MRKVFISLLLGGGLFSSTLLIAETTQRWTLGASIQHALTVAPEMQTANAEIGKQQSILEQAKVWPNPSISVQLDESLGIEDASGGFDITQFEVSQPIPFGRLKYKQKQAEAEFERADAERRYQQLMLEFKVAERFHLLQLTEAKMELAMMRLQQANRYQNKGRQSTTNDPLVRYLTPLETMRLDIVLQAARQISEVAEGEYNEASASFKALLALPIDTHLKQMPLSLASIPAPYEDIQNKLQEHPLFIANKNRLLSAQAGIDVAESERLDDPVFTVYQEQSILGGSRQDSLGFKFSFQIPLWNSNKGKVNQAKFEVHRVQSELSLKQRQLKSDLHKSYLHLGHLIQQAEHYRLKLLLPAKKVFSLTQKGFKSGELNILTLIDANNTYYDAQERYLELLQQGWMELAVVRQSAGISLVSQNFKTNLSENN